MAIEMGLDRAPRAGGISSWIRSVPKVELHLHMEGAIPLDTLWQLIEKYGGDRRAPNRAALDGVFRYADFPSFIETWLWKHAFLREPEDLTLVATAVARELARQRIVYAEAFYSPADLRRTGMSVGIVTEALRRGLDTVPEVDVALIADLVRDDGPAGAAGTLEAVAEVRDQRVIGIGIGGSEHAFPPAQFGAVFERARELGLRTTAHAGEAAGAESIWSAIRDLHVERIGHGTRAVEDPSLVAFLARERLPLEMCPGSNVATGVVPSLAAHPIRELFDAGVLVTVNSDDPAMFGTSLADEYSSLEEVLGFSPAEIRTLMLNAVDASWLPAARQGDVRATVEEGLCAFVEPASRPTEPR